MSAEEVVKLTVEEAMARLVVDPDYDPGGGPGPCVHAFRNPAGMLVGAHWRVEDARALMEEFGAEEAGEVAKASGHGIVVNEITGGMQMPVFFEATP